MSKKQKVKVKKTKKQCLATIFVLLMAGSIFLTAFAGALTKNSGHTELRNDKMRIVLSEPFDTERSEEENMTYLYVPQGTNLKYIDVEANLFDQKDNEDVDVEPIRDFLRSYDTKTIKETSHKFVVAEEEFLITIVVY